MNERNERFVRSVAEIMGAPEDKDGATQVVECVMRRWAEDFQQAAVDGKGDLTLRFYHKALLHLVAAERGIEGQRGLYEVYWNHIKYRFPDTREDRPTALSK